MSIKLHKPTIASSVFTMLLVAHLSGIDDPSQCACAHDLSNLLISSIDLSCTHAQLVGLPITLICAKGQH